MPRRTNHHERLPTTADLDRIETTLQAELDVLTGTIAAIRHHLDLERTHPSRPDGYPTRTPGAEPGTGGPGHRIDRGDEGAGETIDLTSVESAIVARDAWTDNHRTRTIAAVRALQRATDEHYMARCTADALNRGDEAQRDLAAANDPMWCPNHARFGKRTPKASDRGLAHCGVCHEFHKRWGVWPGARLLDAYDRGDRMITGNDRAIQRLLAEQRDDTKKPA